jgi:hypothetical protein
MKVNGTVVLTAYGVLSDQLLDLRILDFAPSLIYELKPRSLLSSNFIVLL